MPEEAQQSGVLIAELCSRYGIATSQFYGWREHARGPPRPSCPHGPGQRAEPGAGRERAAASGSSCPVSVGTPADRDGCGPRQPGHSAIWGDVNWRALT